MSETLDSSPRIRKIEEIVVVLATLPPLKDSIVSSSCLRIWEHASSEGERVLSIPEGPEIQIPSELESSPSH